MKVYVKNSQGKENTINIPLWILGIISGDYIAKFINTNVEKNKDTDNEYSENNLEGAMEKLEFIQYMDKKQLKKCISILSEYEGLKVIEAESSEGTYVKVVI
ncbi:hypothetical protein [Haloimpatiens lingqiaonensis]|uniref:hypothetical protein n=1 Tax=Haloimpatiens lingqiaonensis TaxID=1380675 RepID=UPI0010FD8EEB|nr:hypothetical protein [Haloimpatiens lingqiaonensis]